MKKNLGIFGVVLLLTVSFVNVDALTSVNKNSNLTSLLGVELANASNSEYSISQNDCFCVEEGSQTNEVVYNNAGGSGYTCVEVFFSPIAISCYDTAFATGCEQFSSSYPGNGESIEYYCY